MNSKALIPLTIAKFEKAWLANLLAVLGGVALVSVMAQVVIPLPWTPVPITGQTFAVTLISLMWGFQRGGAVMLSYVALGSMGLPIFAAGQSGALVGPTSGYLVGMIFAAMTIGYLADLGYTRKMKDALLASFLGSIIVYSMGLLGLWYFLPGDAGFATAIAPFIVGDSLKNVAAALLVTRANRQLNS